MHQTLVQRTLKILIFLYHNISFKYGKLLYNKTVTQLLMMLFELKIIIGWGWEWRTSADKCILQVHFPGICITDGYLHVDFLCTFELH